MNPTLEAIQANNCLQLSRDITRIRENDHGLKSILAASNEDCWLVTSGARIEKINENFRIIIRKRKQPNSLKGTPKKSGLCLSKLEAEIGLCSFRFSNE